MENAIVIENDKEEDNFTSQKDEIDVLESIYGDDFVIEDEICPTISVTIHMTKEEKDDAAIVVSFNSGYPKEAPPIYHLSIPWLKRDEIQPLNNSLQEEYLQHLGKNIVYIWVEKLRELLLEIWERRSTTLLQNQNSDSYSNSASPLPEKLSFSPPENVSSLLPLPTIFTGEPLTDRKSTFQAHVAKITHAHHVQLVLSELKKNRKIATATHNMYAYRIFKEETKSWQQDCDDDGETHAGGRLLHLLQILDCSNVLIVVTRWYGGIMLYGDRFKHINNVARQELEKQGCLQNSSPKKRKDKAS